MDDGAQALDLSTTDRPCQYCHGENMCARNITNCIRCMLNTDVRGRMWVVQHHGHDVAPARVYFSKPMSPPDGFLKVRTLWLGPLAEPAVRFLGWLSRQWPRWFA